MPTCPPPGRAVWRVRCLSWQYGGRQVGRGRVAVRHRTGSLPTGPRSFAIAVSSSACLAPWGATQDPDRGLPVMPDGVLGTRQQNPERPQWAPRVAGQAYQRAELTGKRPPRRGAKTPKSRPIQNCGKRMQNPREARVTARAPLRKHETGRGGPLVTTIPALGRPDQENPPAHGSSRSPLRSGHGLWLAVWR
jgi:hypothetical protein